MPLPSPLFPLVSGPPAPPGCDGGGEPADVLAPYPLNPWAASHATDRAGRGSKEEEEEEEEEEGGGEHQVSSDVIFLLCLSLKT